MHKNARLAPKGREVLVHRLQAGQHVAEVDQALRISKAAARKWLHRLADEGLKHRTSLTRRLIARELAVSPAAA